MTLRMELCGTSLCGAVIAGAVALPIGAAAGGATAGAGMDAAGGVAAGAGVAAPPFCAASISARTIRPLGPLPFRPDRSMPAWFAIRRARGETKIRSPGMAVWPPAWASPVAAGAGSRFRRFSCRLRGRRFG